MFNIAKLADDAARQEHILLTALGAQARDCTYSFNGQQLNARLSPVALMRLLPEEKRPHRVIALCTGDAREKTFPV